MARMDRKIEDSRDHIRREMEFLYTRNIHAINVHIFGVLLTRFISIGLLALLSYFPFHL